MEYREKKPGNVRYRGASSGFLKNGQVIGGSTSCFRKAMLRDEGIQAPINTRARITFGIGHMLEDVFAKELDEKGIEYVAEAFHFSEYGERGEIVVALDFVVGGVGYELKGVSSSKAAEKIFYKGEPKLENVAQLANSMIELEIERGCLRYCSAIYHKASKWRVSAGDVKRFEVTFSDGGDILVDNEPYGYNVSHILDHRETCLDFMIRNEVYPNRPADVGPFSACGLCEFKSACDTYDDIGKTKEQFLEWARECIQQ